MPKAAESSEDCITKACEAARREGEPNISKIARQFGVSRQTLSNRVKNRHQPSTTRKPVS
jgi:transposase-like protein